MANNERVIDESGSLQLFNRLINKLSGNKHVKFINRFDEADTFEWCFKFRGHEFSLEYNIFNGLILVNKSANEKAAEELSVELFQTAK
jgi:hypothetical protein